MIFYGEQNVYEAAKDRLRFIFNEFYPHRKIGVTFSGGKDSTVTLFLTKEIMDEFGIEKIPVIFLDQEAETPQTIEYVREIMNLPWVEPYWIQTHFQEWNASKGEWFNVWGPGEKWCREKEPNNPYTDLPLGNMQFFKKTLGKIQHYVLGDDYISLGGVRIEESPSRLSGLTQGNVYKGITWGKNNKVGLALYPIWDWKSNDVWYYIFSKKVPYCKLYNYLFTKYPLIKCRVSSCIHEQSIQNLSFLKEISPEFWTKLYKRVENVNTSLHTLRDMTSYVSELPPYFVSWKEYIEYLAVNLCGTEKSAQSVIKQYEYHINHWKKIFGNYEEGIEYLTDLISKYTAKCIVSEDFELKGVENKSIMLNKYYNNNYTKIVKANKKE